MKEPRLEDYAIIREAMFKGVSVYFELALRELPKPSEDYDRLKELFLKLNPGNELYSDTDISYRERFMQFVAALDVKNPEKFVDAPMDQLKSFANTISMFLAPFKDW
jgi:hypothetical protein